MCGNTPHLSFDQIQARTDLPLLSIVEAAVAAAQQLHLQRLALLGTKFTMQNDFFIKPFWEAGIEVCRPRENNQSIIHQKIVDELESGIVKKETKQQLMTIINKMVQKDHLDGVVLGCTELSLILGQEDFKNIQVFDIAQVQIKAAVDQLLKKTK